MDDMTGLLPLWRMNLNEAQSKAVTCPPGALQILAGPGSGKTRVLTCRVAYLINELHIHPMNLVVVTFTNKAANEMKSRLRSLIGESMTDAVVMGTFHSVCVRFLRKHPKLAKLKKNWSIADHADVQKMIKDIVSNYAGDILVAEKEAQEAKEGKDAKTKGGPVGITSLKPKEASDRISRMKAKNILPGDAMVEAKAKKIKNGFDEILARIYSDYETKMKKNNCLDFDDLLIYGMRLFKDHPHVMENVEHTLVDEFQDTNTVQYELMRAITTASKTGTVTVVGDPDQSIYGWRSAEVENLKFMRSHYPNLEMIFLEENYRSGKKILEAASLLINQDTERIQKSLFTSHPESASVVLRLCNSAPDEATFIAQEIKRAIAHTGNLLNYDDFAVLLRFNALSRNIENAFQKAGIPSRMVGGHKFFDRVEVKDMLAYLQLIDNPSFTPAFLRVVNVPKRSIGDKTLSTIVAIAEERNMTPIEVVTKAVRGSAIAGLTAAQKKNLKPFVELIAQAAKLANEGASVPSLIQLVVTKIQYDQHLAKAYGPDADSRMMNINELKSFAATVDKDNPGQTDDDPVEDDTAGGFEVDDPVGEFDDFIDEGAISGADSGFEEVINSSFSSQSSTTAKVTPLRTFLEVSTLSTDTDTEEATNEKGVQKVTIITCHSAKGLEWPVVFVPAVEGGTFPSYRAKDSEKEMAEDRRLLYVAMTRAQVVLYMTHCVKRMNSGRDNNQFLSSFLDQIVAKKRNVFRSELEDMTADLRTSISTILRRPAIDEAVTTKIIEEYTTTAPPPVPDATASQSNFGYGGYNSYKSGGNYRSGSWGSRPLSSQNSWNARSGSFVSSQGYSSPSLAPPSASQPVTGQYGSFRYASPAPVGPNGSFGSALSLHKTSAPTTTTLSANTTSIPKSTSLAPSLNRSSSNAALTSFPSASQPQLSKPTTSASPLSQPPMTETRLSQIDSAVLVNPTPAPAANAPSLSFFQSAASDSLAALKSLGPVDLPAPARTAPPAPLPSIEVVQVEQVQKGRKRKAAAAPATTAKRTQPKRTKKK